MADFVMVRLPKDLARKIKALDAAREPFVRRAVEAALALRDAPPASSGLPPRGEGNGGMKPGGKPAPPRAFATHIGCERHPEAGAYQGPNGNWWCGDRRCTKAARTA